MIREVPPVFAYIDRVHFFLHAPEQGSGEQSQEFIAAPDDGPLVCLLHTGLQIGFDAAAFQYPNLQFVWRFDHDRVEGWPTKEERDCRGCSRANGLTSTRRRKVQSQLDAQSLL